MGILEDIESIKDPQKLKALKKVLEASIAQERASNGLVSFVPNGAQEELIDVIGDHRVNGKWKFIVPSANGIGKTAATINILGNIIWGSQNSWFKGSVYKEWPYPKKIWYVSEQTTLKDTVVGSDMHEGSEVWKWFPRGRYTVSKGGLDYFSKLRTDTGWEISFRTFDQDATKFESATIGIVALDEPPPEQTYNSCVARLREGGIVILPMTPLFEAAWVESRLLTNPGPETYILQVDREANCKEHGTRGRLSHEQLDRLEAEFSPDQREARTHGIFAHLSGVVYKGLHHSTHRHFRAPQEFTQRDYKIFSVLDPHGARPPALGWFAVNKTEDVWAIGEYPSFSEFGPYNDIRNWQKTDYDVALEIKDFELTCGWDPRLIRRVMDPNYGKQMNAQTGRTTQQLFRKIGQEIEWPLVFSCNVLDSVVPGHNVVAEWLLPDPNGHIKMLFGSPYCENMWHHMTHYGYAPRQGKSLDRHGPGERVAQLYKDYADVVRYMMMFLRRPSEAQQEEASMPEHYKMYLRRRDIKQNTGDWRNPHSV